MSGTLISTVERLAELELKMFPGPFHCMNGDGLTDAIFAAKNEYGEHFIAEVQCHVYTGQKKGEAWPKFQNTEGFVQLRNAAPKLLDVLGHFQAGDAETIAEIMQDDVCSCEDPYCRKKTMLLERLQKSASLMEADDGKND